MEYFISCEKYSMKDSVKSSEMKLKFAVIISALLLSTEAQYAIEGSCPEPCSNSKIKMTNDKVNID